MYVYFYCIYVLSLKFSKWILENLKEFIIYILYMFYLNVRFKIKFKNI